MTVSDNNIMTPSKSAKLIYIDEEYELMRGTAYLLM